METGKARPVVEGPFEETLATFSPDGRYVTYASDETGRTEVYLRSLPGEGSPWQISLEGGQTPVWRADGREMFFYGEDGFIHAVEVDLEGGVNIGTPRPLFRAQMRFDRGDHYDVAPDGQSFVINTPMIETTPRPMSVALNWSPDRTN